MNKTGRCICICYNTDFTLTPPVYKARIQHRVNSAADISSFWGALFLLHYLDDLCFIHGLFLLQHINEHIDVWMGTSTHSVENVVPSFHWVGGSWAVTVRVVPELKMSLQSLKRMAAAVLSSLSSQSLEPERGRQLASQVDEGCQVFTKFSCRATVLGVPLNTLREVKETSPMVVFGKFAFAAFLAAFSKSIIQDRGASTDWLEDVHCWL